jgi:hypothetical protein
MVWSLGTRAFLGLGVLREIVANAEKIKLSIKKSPPAKVVPTPMPCASVPVSTAHQMVMLGSVKPLLAATDILMSLANGGQSQSQRLSMTSSQQTVSVKNRYKTKK